MNYKEKEENQMNEKKTKDSKKKKLSVWEGK